MRHYLLAVALAVAMGSTSLAASAADNNSEIAELKAQLAALTAKVVELEERNDAQSGVNIDTAAQLDKLTTGTTVVDTKGGIKVTSADKKFEATVGGRIHFDAYAFDRDIAPVTGTDRGLKGQAVVFKVSSLSDCRRLLTERGVAFRERDNRLLVPPVPGQGVLFVFGE